MAKPYDNSLLLRMGVTMAAITMLGFLTMLGSIIIEEMTQGEAAAINQAGSLRMQSYRIATHLVYHHDYDAQKYWDVTNQLVQEFEDRLYSTRLTSVIPNDDSHVLNKSYDRIEDQWHRKIRPVLLVYVGLVVPRSDEGDTPTQEQQALWAANQKNIRSRYLSIVDNFVEDIDLLVKNLEEDAEAKIRWLRFIQISSMFLIIAIVFRAMYFMHTSVLHPMRDLLDFAERARRGDLSMRIRHYSRDELGQLGSAFNGMADDLSKIHANLEHRVQEQTSDLERSNRTLQLLYKATSRLNNTDLSPSVYQELLYDIETLTGFGPGIICLANVHSNSVETLATTRKPTLPTPPICGPENCAACMEQQETLVKTWVEGGTRYEAVTIPLREQSQHYGILFLSAPPKEPVQNWQIQLLEAIADHISLSIGRSQRASASRRLSLHEERGVIARELHDSLAQSLSYLKIQVSRLNMVLQSSESPHSAETIAEELRNGLNGAYRQLRELLTTFRLKPDEKGFLRTLDDTVTEFSQQHDIEITLDNKIENFQLNENEEIHALQVIREALSNVIKHAKASKAMVTLNEQENGVIEVTIEDNGIGIPSAPERTSHYGLAIMYERVRSLNGELDIRPISTGGTRVRFNFRPKISNLENSERLQSEI